MNAKKKPDTLGKLQAEVNICQTCLNNFDEENDDPEMLLQLREDLREAREALRIFSYKAKPCLTKNGRVLRP